MRRSRVLCVALAAMLALTGVASTAAAAGPPEDQVTIVGPFVDSIDCGSASITRTLGGWVGIPSETTTPTFYHLARVYTNAAGRSWIYMDTGLIRTFVKDGVLFVSLSGRSVNIGPNDTGWVGYWELNAQTGEVTRVGHAIGDVDQRACTVLVPA